MLKDYKAKDKYEILLNRFSNADAILNCPGVKETDKETLWKIRNDLKAEILEIMRRSK